MARPSSLPKPAEDLVLGALRKCRKPLSAYEILERVKKFGINSSPIVYRALDVLIKKGHAHRINELNAFIACTCSDDHAHDVSVLTVCRDCKQVDELHDHELIRHLVQLRRFQVNLPHAAVVELPITCTRCVETVS